MLFLKDQPTAECQGICSNGGFGIFFFFLIQKQKEKRQQAPSPELGVSSSGRLAAAGKPRPPSSRPLLREDSQPLMACPLRAIGSHVAIPGEIPERSYRNLPS